MAETRVDLLTRPAAQLAPALAGRPAWVPGLVAAGWSAGVSLVGFGAVSVVAWLASGASGDAGAALRGGALGWLVAHGAGVEVAGLPLSVVPWGLTLVLILLQHRAGRWAAATGGPAGARDAMLCAAVPSLAYGTAAALLAMLASTAAVAVDPRRAFLAAGLVALAGLGSGVLRETGASAALAGRLPARARRVAAAAGVGVAAVLAGGALLVVLGLVASLGRVHGLLSGLDAGFVGGALLTLVGAALLPNAAVWASALAVGPGFSLGAGTTVVTGHATVGLLPALPLLAAVPERVPAPLGALLLALPLGAGAAMAWVLRRRASERGLPSSLLDAVLAAAGAAVLLGLAVRLTSGSAGAHRLAAVGASAGPVVLAAAGELAVGALAGIVVLRLRPR